MDVRNCPRCKKVFTYMNSPLCPDCLKQEEDDFHKLKNYIDENPHCTLQEISDATEIQPKKIMKFLKEGRLEISKGMRGALKCGSCGKPIARGKFCDSCVIRISQGVNELFGKGNNNNDDDDKNKGPKMHITGSKRL